MSQSIFADSASTTICLLSAKAPNEIKRQLARNTKKEVTIFTSFQFFLLLFPLPAILAALNLAHQE
jgi:hypothetical protein